MTDLPAGGSPGDTYVGALERLTEISARRTAMVEMLLGKPVTEWRGRPPHPEPPSLRRTLGAAYRELQDEALRELDHLSCLVGGNAAALLMALESADAAWLIFTLMERVAVAEGGGPG